MEQRIRRIFVFHRWEHCPPGIKSERVLVEVPGEWAHSVMSLVRASQQFRHSGLMVTNVGAGSQGARAGMKCGDVLMRFDGQELDSAATLRRLSQVHTQAAAAQKPIRIEAARGADDLVFEVFPGQLGITVSPLLYRRGARKGLWRRILEDVFGTNEPTRRVMPHVIHTVEEARSHNAESPALVVVPGDLARPVLGVVRAMAHASSRKRKRARSLLLAARHLG